MIVLPVVGTLLLFNVTYVLIKIVEDFRGGRGAIAAVGIVGLIGLVVIAAMFAFIVLTLAGDF